MMRWLSVAAGVIIADQLTKWWVVSTLALGERVQVLPVFAWVRWHNEGAAFSFLAGAGGWQRWFFVALAVGFSGYLIYEISRLRREEGGLGWVYGLILGGALGNLLDRLLHGHVVDFVLVHYQDYIFPAFNVADSALFCGAALWILLMIRDHRMAAHEARDVADHR
jgi:signal peptidase II